VGVVSATYEVTLGPAAVRTVQSLWDPHDQNELAIALRTELREGPNADKELELKFPFDGDFQGDVSPLVPGGVAYTATPLSFNGCTAFHRPMTEEELQRLGREQSRAVADHGCFVIDILSAESAFGRPRLT
jgi:hypothetical protein